MHLFPPSVFTNSGMVAAMLFPFFLFLLGCLLILSNDDDEDLVDDDDEIGEAVQMGVVSSELISYKM